MCSPSDLGLTGNIIFKTLDSEIPRGYDNLSGYRLGQAIVIMQMFSILDYRDVDHEID